MSEISWENLAVIQENLENRSFSRRLEKYLWLNIQKERQKLSFRISVQ
jgi:hypothetical protein